MGPHLVKVASTRARHTPARGSGIDRPPVRARISCWTTRAPFPPRLGWRPPSVAHAELPVVTRRFGETLRPDRWWVQPALVFTLLSVYGVYATWAAFQGAHYTW